MVGKCRDIIKTRYEASKLVFLSDSENEQFIIKGLSKQLWKIVVNSKKVKKQELRDTLLNHVKDKVPNVPAGYMNRK